MFTIKILTRNLEFLTKIQEINEEPVVVETLAKDHCALLPSHINNH